MAEHKMYSAECRHAHDSMNIAVLNEHRCTGCSTTVIVTREPYTYDILNVVCLLAHGFNHLQCCLRI
jgi:Ni,Fe-hydrogenase I small subunit